MFEAQIDQNTLVAQVSQSAQWAVSDVHPLVSNELVH